MKRHLRGVLNLDKPRGITSYDCIRRLKRVLSCPQSEIGNRKSEIPLGHAGTLDPMASGVLLILFGEATRLSRFLMASDKEYEAIVLFGRATDTDDITGRILGEAPVPEMNASALRRLLTGFTGEQSQVPPRFSALKQDGTPMYRRARRGEEFEVKPRKVNISELELLDWDPPTARLRVRVSSGTYLRALARDVGRAAGTLATLSGLVRTRSGRFAVENALPLDKANQEAVAERIVSIEEALPELPRIEVSEAQARLLLQGRLVETDPERKSEEREFCHLTPRSLDPLIPSCSEAFAATGSRKFLCLVRVHEGRVRPVRLIYAE